MKLPFQKSDPARTGHQYLEDLSTAYWYSEVLFTAMELEIFRFVDLGHDRIEKLAGAARCGRDELLRLMTALERLELIGRHEGRWFNQTATARFLLPQSPDYMGDFLGYRRYMQAGWRRLSQKMARRNRTFHPAVTLDDDYQKRTDQYVRALDALARQKAKEIAAVMEPLDWQGLVLDAGGGAGSLSRSLLARRRQNVSVLLELPEVLSAADQLYPCSENWTGIYRTAGDFRHPPFPAGQRFGLVILSNFLHAYNGVDARNLLEKAVRLLSDGGILLIHDYFPDRTGNTPHKGPLYDLNMMVNTYQGACHRADTLVRWLKKIGLKEVVVRDLDTDTALILAGNNKPVRIPGKGKRGWVEKACNAGFRQAVLLPASQVRTAAWVRMKCRYGCPRYGFSRQCPPETQTPEKTRWLLDDYRWALLVEGTPPGRSFHERLLDLEKQAFLAGFHRALIFGAGPCPLCSECTTANACRHPEKVRPAMEACGIDVYATAKGTGIRLTPVPDRTGYVKYFGLLLME